MIHVAVLLRPYVDLILSGRKTVECRLTVQAREPYECIEAGERIYFKQSAGPYRATAIADHVQCERNLTQRRVRELQRDYNEHIRGDASFWRMKRHSNFATLIWLREVQPIETGPAIPNLQGRAWLALPEEPAWRRYDAPPHQNGCFGIAITEGNLRNNTLYITSVFDRFPAWSHGGMTKREAGKPLTLALHAGPIVETDIVAPRKLLRTRVWGTWFRNHGAQPGDQVVFTPVDERTYFVGLVKERSVKRPRSQAVRRASRA